MQPLTAVGSTSATISASDERALVVRARQGDREAFDDIVAARSSSTVRTMTAILGDPADARDATQAAFVHAWQSLPRLRDPDAFAGWFGRIVVNTARSSLRSRRRRSVREIPVGELAGEIGTARTAGHEERTEAIDRLERAFDRLAPHERLVLWLHHYEELPLTEIGVRMGVPAKTVKSRLFTARRALERALEAEDR
jgi:RNA polymerase sigma-70 factor (ECF subfamily)